MTLLLLLLAWSQAFAGTLTVEVLDVGQGDAILIRTPAGKSILIDAGTGRPDVVPMLEARGLTALDLVIGTHAHADHIGGMDEVLEALPVRLYGDQGLPHTTTTYSHVMELVEQKGIQYLTLRQGRVFKLDDGIRLEVLGPQEPLLLNTRSDLNANSVVTRLVHGKNCFLFTGDSEEPTEHRLIADQIGSCAVLKVAHHGSDHSTTVPWLAEVKPQIALISVGARNRYGHPDDAALARLETAGADIYRTDRMGTLRVLSDGKTVRVEEVDERALSGAGGGLAAVGVRASVPSGAVATGIVAPLPERPVALRAVAPEAVPAPLARAVEAAGGSLSGAGFIAINRATIEELQVLPGIGPAKAAAIVRHRETHGAFASLADLDAVAGIGPATIEKLDGQVSFAP